MAGADPPGRANDCTKAASESSPGPAVDPTRVGDFLAVRHTSAPLRMTVTAQYDVTPEVLFARVAHHRELLTWVPLLRDVTMDRARPDPPVSATDEVGAVRVCKFHGMGTVREEIVWWEPPHGYAYTASARLLPMRDHLGTFLIEPAGAGRSSLRLEQRWHDRGPILGRLLPTMLTLLFERAYGNLRRQLGGGPPSIRLHRG